MKFALEFALIAILIIFAFAIDGYMAVCPRGTPDRPAIGWWVGYGKKQFLFIK